MTSIKEEQISPRGYLYLIILAKRPFNDTQFNMSRSLMLFPKSSQSTFMFSHFFVPFIHFSNFCFYDYRVEM